MPLQIIRQDITKMKVDAIVNTTNEKMVGYSGVDYAVHQAAGPELYEECKKIVPLGVGTAKITKGHNLDAKYVIHTSGPIWQGGLEGESILLKSCYLESLKLAVEYGCDSVAFPLISSGTYGYPKDQVLKFAVQVISEFLLDHELSVFICIFDRKSYEFSQVLFEEISGYVELMSGLTDHTRCAVSMSCERLAEEQLSTPDAKADDDSDKYGIPDFLKWYKADGFHNAPLHDYMKEMDKSFAKKLFDLIDARAMTDVECYKKANVDKKTFSKIKCNPDTYRPSKQTAVAFAIALELNLEETQDLLASAGLTLSRSFVFDNIIRFFILRGNYNIFEINEALFEFDQMLLGC